MERVPYLDQISTLPQGIGGICSMVVKGILLMLSTSRKRRNDRFSMCLYVVSFQMVSLRTFWVCLWRGMMSSGLI